MQRTRCSCQILMKLGFFGKFFEKFSNTKILENPTSWSRIIPREPTDGQTDTHTQTNTYTRTQRS